MGNIMLLMFVSGYLMYRKLDPAGSPFTRLAQVVVAAYRKRKLPTLADSGNLYENDELDVPISISGKLLMHTDYLSFFDKAAIVTEEDRAAATVSGHPNLWRLNTVHRVEELKAMARMTPIWLSGILVSTASSQQGTFSFQQVGSMDRRITPTSTFLVPPDSMAIFTMLAMLSTISIYDGLLIPLARRGISFIHRMGIGMAVSVLATLVAGFVEERRRNVAATHGLLDSPTATIPASFYWLVPQYALHGVAEAFMFVGLLEFFYDQAPESVRSTATALFWMVLSAGSYLSFLIVSVAHRYTDWLPDNINRGKLEYFYWFITMLQMVNLMYYVICAKFYTFKPIEVKGRREEGEGTGGVELTSEV